MTARGMLAAVRRRIAGQPRLRGALLRLAGPAFPALRRAFNRAEAPPYHAWFARWQASSAAEDAAIAAAAGAPLPFLLIVPGGTAGAGTRASIAAQVAARPTLVLPEAAAAAIDRLAAEGGYVLRLETGETLARHALAAATAALRRPGTRPLVLFADEDVRGQDGRHRDPWFKASFDPDRLLQQDSLGRAVLLDAGLLVRHGLVELRGHALTLAATQAACAEAGTDAIRHLPAVLLHRSPGDVPAPWRSGSDAAAVASALAGAGGGIVQDATARPLRLRWPLPVPAPLVSVLIPTRDRADLMRTCLEGLLRRTDYPSLDVIVIDNGSTDPALADLLGQWAGDARLRVLPMPGPFNFAALNNRAVAEARGDVLVLLNNDTEVRHADWLAELVSQALRPGIGAVGARLLYPDGRVQHAGVGLGLGGIAAHEYLFMPGTADGPQDALRVVRTVSAVTAACLAVRRDAYLAVGGMDEARFAVAYNDIDLCLKLRRAGLRNIVTPHAELLHHESATRGSDLAPERRARWEAECAAMRALWGPELAADPWLSPMLSRADAYGRLAEPPAALLPWAGTGARDAAAAGHGPGSEAALPAPPAEAEDAPARQRAAARRAQAEAAALMAELHQLRSSTLWRATGPLRALGLRHPGLAEACQEALRLCRWAAAGHLLPRLRERRAAAAARAAAERHARATAEAAPPARAARRPRTLVVDHQVPEPDRDGGSRAIMAAIEALLATGRDVTFLPADLRGTPGYTEALERRGVAVVREPWTRRAEDWLAANGHAVDEILLSRPGVALALLPALRAHSQAPVAYYGHDLHFARMAQEPGAARPAQQAAIRDMRALERRLWRIVDMVLYLSEEEVQQVRLLEPGVPVRAVPANALPPRPPRRQVPHGGVLFVGGFRHGPNVAAACLLAQRIMPLLRAQVPGVALTIIGSSPTPEVLALAGAGVTVRGSVTDEELEAAYAEARVALCPLRFGAGVKLKVLEAMHHGLPVVTTGIGAQGLAGLDQVCDVAEAEEALAAAAARLLVDDAHWLARSAAQGDYIAAHFSPAALQRALADAFAATTE